MSGTAVVETDKWKRASGNGVFTQTRVVIVGGGIGRPADAVSCNYTCAFHQMLIPTHVSRGATLCQERCKRRYTAHFIPISGRPICVCYSEGSEGPVLSSRAHRGIRSGRSSARARPRRSASGSSTTHIGDRRFANPPVEDSSVDDRLKIATVSSVPRNAALVVASRGAQQLVRDPHGSRVKRRRPNCFAASRRRILS